jgi:hypothetical protein
VDCKAFRGRPARSLPPNRDDAAWEAAIAGEEENRAVLADAAENWAVVENYLRERRAQ